MRDGTAKLLAGTVLLLATMAAWLYMRSQHMEDTGLLALVSPVITYLILGGKVDAAADGQNATLAHHSETLAKISRNTNGELDRRIVEGSRAAITEALAHRDAAIAAGVVTTAPAITAAAAARTTPDVSTELAP